MDVMSAHSETDDPNGEGEGVWSPDIEQAFQEALRLFPPCGRRKHILQEEGGGKMYGRNELIARYIYQKTGHVRTRKQVSSHIQVLSRREARTKSSSHRGDSESVSPVSSITASSIGADRTSRPDSATSGYNNNGNSNGIIAMDTGNGGPLNNHYNLNHHLTATTTNLTTSNPYDLWEDRPIMTRKIRLVEFSAFIEQRKLTSLTNGNSGGASNQSTTISQATQAAVLASLVATGGGPDPATAAATGDLNQALPNGNIHLQVPPFAAAYANGNSSSLAPRSSQPHLAAHPHLASQFVNHSATIYPQINGNSHQHPHHYQNHHHQHHQLSNELLLTTSTNGNNTAAHDLGSATQQPPSGFHRHSFVKIDYRQLSERQANKMERIDIREIQDKFPDIGGPDGLFQRGSTDNFFLVKFWADLDYDSDYGLFEDQNSYLGFSSHFETAAPFRDITCSTKACSYGNQVVEKVEKMYGAFNSSNNTYSYAINKSPMCEFMIQFIKKLRQLPELPLMNRILENFTVLQLVTSESTSEILLCIAYVFEIASLRHPSGGGGGGGSSGGSHYHVYKLHK